MYYLLYNPTSNKNKKDNKEKIIELYNKKFEGIKPVVFIGLDFEEFCKNLTSDDIVILSGGDGTINHFANYYKKHDFKAKILYSANGTGNDFLRDIGKDDLVDLKPYLNNLPKVTVNGETRYFINNSSFGIDGTVCEVADKLKAKNKKYSYTKIAAKLLLFKYKPTKAKIIIDGKEYHYDDVWLASSMNGRYVGGGMMLAPNQDRMSNELSCVIIHKSKRIKTAIAFLSIFKGNHIKKYKKYVDILKGKNIYVEFDRPNAIQIDGETILNVTNYKAAIGE